MKILEKEKLFGRHRKFKTIIFILIVLSIVISGCSPILQSAELAQPKEFRYTLRSGIFMDDFGKGDNILPNGLGYHIAYGVNKYLEVNGDIDIFFPRTSLGVKIKLIKKLSFSSNINTLNDDLFNSLVYPDFSLIYGYKTYCGIRTSILIDKNDINGISQVFLGKKIGIFNKSYLIPEFSVSSLGYLNIGLGFEF